MSAGLTADRRPLVSINAVRALGVVLLVLGVGVLAAAFRAVHLGTPSLWWDEIVEIDTATRPSDTLVGAIKWGSGRSRAGNAGAMPLDYVLLHLYRAGTPAPHPDRLEAYWRAPAFVYSVAAAVVVTMLLARTAGIAAAALGGTFLALSVPAALYAAEVRPYSLMVLLGASSLATAVDVARPDAGRGAWARFAAVGLLFLTAGVPAVPVLVAEGGAVLALALARGHGLVAARRLATTGAIAAAALATYWYGIRMDIGLGHPESTSMADALVQTCSFFLTGEPWYQWPVPVAIALASLALVHARVRASRAWPLVAVALTSLVALPILIVLINLEAYYFHVRHALVLLPAFTVLVAVGAVGVVETILHRRRAQLAAAVVVGAGLALGPAISFVREPFRYFHWTKTLHEWKPVLREAERLAAGERVVLVAENQSREDDRANYVGGWYVRAHGLADRVLFCATPNLALEDAMLKESQRLNDLRLLDYGCTPILDLTEPGQAAEEHARLDPLDLPTVGAPEPIRRWAFVAFRPHPPLPGMRAIQFPGLVLLAPTG
jgi:hypothetical protein